MSIEQFSIVKGELIRYTGNDKHVTIPAEVTSISEEAFCRCIHLESVVLPDGCCSIGTRAFAFCIKLRSLVIPEGIIAIGAGAFEGCEELGSIIIPNSVRNIGSRTFEGCQNLKSITIPEGVTVIEEATFRWCKNLKVASIPRSMVSINDFAFEGCKDIELVISNDSQLQIGNNAFANTNSILLDRYINNIEKSGTFKKLIIKGTQLQSITHVWAKKLAVMGFLTAKDASVFTADVVQSYKRYLKRRLSDYMTFILNDDVTLIMNRLCSLDLIDLKTASIFMEHDLPVSARAVLIDYCNKRKYVTDSYDDFHID